MNSIEESKAIKEVLDFYVVEKGVEGIEFIELALMLSEFTIIFREDHGIECMVRYIQWAVTHGEDKDSVFATLGHDIGGRHDRCFSPRTSSYQKEN
jgi:hypothetical protein